ncbi:ATP-binding cassette domain-containing protein [Herpetosiphon giganteus]|uniref:ATP-binding cassette domain-containing protein n=1 Tax=Herpetosiphon giganteus TaxID=2029754 RepID=UPI00195DAF58|nr:ATP-binding cassette domain-containing protein [Herpetosiphon giganteus]MBM7843453.1 ABC-2 type transport system ATP-binding protein [Herpetosiphon giganteus]
MIILETKELAKSFRVRGRLVEAVKGVTMSVQAGEIFGFLGPNGAGKTTTMRMLTTLLKPSSGQATIAGIDLFTNSRQVREKIGYVSQDGGAEGASTARENLILQGRFYGLSLPDAVVRAKELLAALDLEQIADRPSSSYSGGQRRRLDLALGMVHKPKLLLLDEPTAALDPQSRAWLWTEVRRLNAEGTTVFMTTHYLDEADALCQRLAIIDDGRIVVEGTPDALKRQIVGDTITLGLQFQPETGQQVQALLQEQSYIHSLEYDEQAIRLVVDRGAEALPKILRLIDDANVQVQTVELSRPSLDDVFLKQTGRSLRESAN